MDELREERREENAYVLDFLTSGKSHSSRSEPLAQMMGEEKFTLLEATIKPGAVVAVGERVYIGKDEREKILLIKSRITWDELTTAAKGDIDAIVLKIVQTNEKRFVEIFNTAGPLNIREHALELLPGIGKKHLEAILKARETKKFESFADISARIPQLQDPSRPIKERIISELQGNERFYMFTKPYRKIPGRF